MYVRELLFLFSLLIMLTLSNLCNIETQRDIHQKATDELADAGLEGLHLR